MADISGFGLVVNVKASASFPAGFQVSQFADDGDSLDIPSMQLADKAMGLNGDLVTWSKAAPLTLTMNIIPNSEDDKNLSVVAEANRVGKGKKSAQDVITITVAYPDGKNVTYTNGKMTDGMPGNGVASAGRYKSKAYAFAFENVTGL